MKKLMVLAVATGALALSGCASVPYQPGLLYTQQMAPVAATNSDVACERTGTAESVNILGLVGRGDASIDQAKKNGGITVVSSVDYQHKVILGVYSKTTTIVCGQ